MALAFSENLEEGQLVIKTMTNREWAEYEECHALGGISGYWLFKYHSGLRELEPIAKFTTRMAIDDFALGLDQRVIFWEDEDA